MIWVLFNPAFGLSPLLADLSSTALSITLRSAGEAFAIAMPPQKPKAAEEVVPLPAEEDGKENKPLAEEGLQGRGQRKRAPARLREASYFFAGENIPQNEGAQKDYYARAAEIAEHVEGWLALTMKKSYKKAAAAEEEVAGE